MHYEVLDRPLPGIQITTNPQGGNLLVRIYKKEAHNIDVKFRYTSWCVS